MRLLLREIFAGPVATLAKGEHFLDSKFLLFELLDCRQVGHGSGHFLLKLLIKASVLQLESTCMRRFHWRYSFASDQFGRRFSR